MASPPDPGRDDLPTLEPEVLPPERQRVTQPLEERFRLMRYALLIDALNFLLRGGIAVRFGFPIGATAAYFLLRHLGWRGARLATAVVLAGFYVMAPDPGWVPLAAIAALLAPLGGRPAR